MNTAEYANKASVEATVENMRNEITRMVELMKSKTPTREQVIQGNKIMAEYEKEAAEEVAKLRLRLMIKAMRRQMDAYAAG